MPAIITTPFRVNNARKIASLADDTFITVGKSDNWPNNDENVQSPLSAEKEIEIAKRNMVAMKLVEASGAKLVIPRVNWLSSPFKEWDPSDETSFIAGTVGAVQCLPCYCVVGLNVYKCVSNVKDISGQVVASTVAPNHTTLGVETLGDGYRWAYMYTVPVDSKFITRDFIEVPDGVNNDPNPTDGRIYGYRVKAGGSGYTSAPTLMIVGDGTTASATASLSGNVVANAIVTGGTAIGQDYTAARVFISGGGGTGAVIEPLVAPRGGHGYEPAIELAAHYVGLAADFQGNENEDFPTANDYRQIGVLVNPLAQNGNDLALITDDGYASGLSYIQLNTPPIASAVPVDSILYQTTTNAKAFVDYYDAGSGRIYFHQNDSTLVNYNAFNTVNPISVYAAGSVSTAPNAAPAGGSSNIGTAIAVEAGEYKTGTGSLIFLENRRKITRADAQTEEIRVIIEL